MVDNIDDVLKKSKYAEKIELSELLKEESDRGCALLVCSYIEYELENLLRSKLVNDETEADILLKRGSLTNINSRINMSYLLGLISKEQKNNLIRIKNIRNKFGHSYKKVEFEDEEIKDICKKLRFKFNDFIDDYTIRDLFIYNAEYEIEEIIKTYNRTERIEEKKNDLVKHDRNIKLIVNDKEDFFSYLEGICMTLDKYHKHDLYKNICEDKETKELLYKYFCENEYEDVDSNDIEIYKLSKIEN